MPGEEDGDRYGSRVKAEVEQQLRSAAALDDWLQAHPPHLRWLTDFPPAEISAEEAVVTELATSSSITQA